MHGGNINGCGDEKLMDNCSSSVQDRNEEGQVLLDFTKRMEMESLNMYFQKEGEDRVVRMCQWTIFFASQKDWKLQAADG